MKGKKLLGLIIGLVGVAMLLFSNYIAEQVALGRAEIRQGQRTVDSVDSLFGSSSYTKPVGKLFTSSAQRKINAGSAEASHYETVSNQLKIGGIILIIIGAGLMFFPQRRRS